MDSIAEIFQKIIYCFMDSSFPKPIEISYTLHIALWKTQNMNRRKYK